MSAAGTSPCAFSAGLAFNTKDIKCSSANALPKGKDETRHKSTRRTDHTAGNDYFPFVLSEEEQLLRKAAKLRRSIETDLLPRQERVDGILRDRRRQLVKLQRHSPGDSFLKFRQMCVVRRDRLRLFEELVVQSLLKEALDNAVHLGEVTLPAQWRKSNQRQDIRNFIQLELHVYLALAGNHSAGYTSSEPLKHETAVIHRHLSALWTAYRKNVLTDAFLDSYYTLRDAVEGWGSGWYARVSCGDVMDDFDSNAHFQSGNGTSTSRSCPFYAWESLCADERLSAYALMCPRHLTAEVVDSLETLVVKGFVNVWKPVDKVINSPNVCVST